MKKFTTIPPALNFAEELELPRELFFCIRDLVLTCRRKMFSTAQSTLHRLCQSKNLTTEHILLLRQLNKKFVA